MEFARSALRNFHQKHERVKHTVHTAWRYPLPPWGRFVMGCIYFSIPVVGGYAVMQWAISKSWESIGERGEKLRLKSVEGRGDVATLEDGTDRKIGAGGFGMGVHLAQSSAEDQERNRQMLERFFKKERRRRKKMVDEGKEGSAGENGG
mmetsp:Transcript_15101/g.32891  ORF Transcript_15101/g.32891 Transcript_15101/m.32891 type:complete len:149 (+) Transcript_15101:51-497(+)